SFRSVIGQEVTATPGCSGPLPAFFWHPWLLLHFPFSLGNGEISTHLFRPMPGTPPSSLTPG
ncbi:MAG: hypothetical protein LAT83_15275, partial [Kiritimatiellae bacterium]|nr:hypothetical protein [Kiritimatiellia bacterium]